MVVSWKVDANVLLLPLRLQQVSKRKNLKDLKVGLHSSRLLTYRFCALICFYMRSLGY